jgi:DNA-binding MarR family transcriptional regulator
MSRERRAAVDALNAEMRGWQVDQEIFDGSVAELAGLNRTQWRCLDILTTRGPLTAGELAQASRLTTGAVTAVVDQLEAAGLVRRVRDPADRRRVFVEATDLVAERGAAVYGPLIADAETAVARFSDEELAAVTAFVRAQRELLGRHTARVYEMLSRGRQTAGGRTKDPVGAISPLREPRDASGL